MPGPDFQFAPRGGSLLTEADRVKIITRRLKEPDSAQQIEAAVKLFNRRGLGRSGMAELLSMIGLLVELQGWYPQIQQYVEAGLVSNENGGA